MADVMLTHRQSNQAAGVGFDAAGGQVAGRGEAHGVEAGRAGGAGRDDPCDICQRGLPRERTGGGAAAGELDDVNAIGARSPASHEHNNQAEQSRGSAVR